VQRVAFDTPVLVNRILPVKLVRLVAPISTGGTTLPAGTLLYIVVNDAGKAGYCTLKDLSSGHAAKSLFIPMLDKRPCFVDQDNDGQFDASFSVFEAYTLLSPPQARGSIDSARPIATPVRYETVDVHLFPAEMTLTYVLGGGDTPAKTGLSITLDRPGHTDTVSRRAFATGQGGEIEVLGTTIVVKSVKDRMADVDVRIPPHSYVYAKTSGSRDGTIFTPDLPPIAAFK
jgi:hypothetical protein